MKCGGAHASVRQFAVDDEVAHRLDVRFGEPLHLPCRWVCLRLHAESRADDPQPGGMYNVQREDGTQPRMCGPAWTNGPVGWRAAAVVGKCRARAGLASACAEEHHTAAVAWADLRSEARWALRYGASGTARSGPGPSAAPIYRPGLRAAAFHISAETINA
jgi:hypothetical protein